MYKLSFKKRVWIVKQYLKGSSISGILCAQNVSRMTLFALIRKYEEFGWDETNGKIERFFLTYKTEYITGTFNNIKDYITHYNTKRLHMSLNYKTPQEIWNEFKNTN